MKFIWYLCGLISELFFTPGVNLMEKLLNRRVFRKGMVVRAQQEEAANPNYRMLKKFQTVLKVGWIQKALQRFPKMLEKDVFMQMAKLLVIGIHHQRGGR